MKWLDIEDIAIALEEKYPMMDILSLRFTDLWQYVQNLEDFADVSVKCNEKILEAIQMAWLRERE